MFPNYVRELSAVALFCEEEVGRWSGVTMRVLQGRTLEEEEERWNNIVDGMLRYIHILLFLLFLLHNHAFFFFALHLTPRLIAVKKYYFWPNFPAHFSRLFNSGHTPFSKRCSLCLLLLTTWQQHTWSPWCQMPAGITTFTELFKTSKKQKHSLKGLFWQASRTFSSDALPIYIHSWSCWKSYRSVLANTPRDALSTLYNSRMMWTPCFSHVMLLPEHIYIYIYISNYALTWHIIITNYVKYINSNYGVRKLTYMLRCK